MEPTRKVQLFEKRADSGPVSTFPGSTMRIISGGGIPYDMRASAARGEEVTPLDTNNLLGDLESDTNIGPTEMEFSVQLPSCQMMRERDRTQRLHFDTTYQNIQVHHWIKVSILLHIPLHSRLNSSRSSCACQNRTSTRLVNEGTLRFRSTRLSTSCPVERRKQTSRSLRTARQTTWQGQHPCLNAAVPAPHGAAALQLASSQHSPPSIQDAQMTRIDLPALR